MCRYGFSIFQVSYFMKTTKLFSRFITLFLLLLFGMAIGAKSGGLDTLRFSVFLVILGVLSWLHIKMMRKKFARFHNAAVP